MSSPTSGFEGRIQAKLQEAARQSSDPNDQADNIVWAAVAANAGLGVLPFGINIWTFILANTLMVSMLGRVYGYTTSKEQAGALIKTLFGAVGFTFLATTLGLKFFAEVLKGLGVITMGGATVGGMALDAILAGGITFAIGFTSKEYFAKGRTMSKQALRDAFRRNFEQGKSQMRQKQAG
jgi:uncharacterized protein (DUF697 family)